MSTYKEFVEKLGAVLRDDGKGHIARCLIHQPDNTPSLRIDEGAGGKVLLHCFVCGSDVKADLVAAAAALGLSPDGKPGFRRSRSRHGNGQARPPFRRGDDPQVKAERERAELERIHERNRRAAERASKTRRPEEPWPDDEERYALKHGLDLPSEIPDDLDQVRPLTDEQLEAKGAAQEHQAGEGDAAGDGADTDVGDEGEQRRPAICNVATLARHLKLPEQHLLDNGLSDDKWKRTTPSVRIPYYDDSGAVFRIRYRIAIRGDDPNRKFRWREGDEPCLYGLHHIARHRETGEIHIVEGESDTLTLLAENFAAVGVPGNTNWRESRDARHLDGFAKIYVVIEPGSSGEGMLRWLANSSIKGRCYLICMQLPHKDPNALYKTDPLGFADAWGALQAAAISWGDFQRAADLEAREEAKAKAKRLLACDNVLDAVIAAVRLLGVVGEAAAIKLIYLAVTSRLLGRIVSLVVKGLSSAGKSYTVEQVLLLFPLDAYSIWSGMSERALIYDDEPLAHRVLAFFEITAIDPESFLATLLRTALSEGVITYKTVERVGGSLHSRTIVRSGPIALLVTTTKQEIEKELENRLMAITVTDTVEQTLAILDSQAKTAAEEEKAEVDLAEFHALQTYLRLESNKVIVPYAPALVALIKQTKSRHGLLVRLRRDHPALLSLIRAHALLHQDHRERTEKGTLVASIRDYEIVGGLLNDVMSDAAGITVPRSVRETCEAVGELTSSDGSGGPPPKSTTISALVSVLGLDRSAVSRRVSSAVHRGFLRYVDDAGEDEDREGRKRRYRGGRGHKLQIARDDKMPVDERLLPDWKSVWRQHTKMRSEKLEPEC